MNDSRPKVEWLVDKQWVSDEGYVVQVNKLPLRWPRYSVVVGILRVKGDEQSVSRFIPVMVSGRGQGKPVVDSLDVVVAKMLVEAREYIQSELQRLEDENMEFKISKEQRQLNKDKPRPKRGLSGGPGSGKTARKRAAKRGEA